MNLKLGAALLSTLLALGACSSGGTGEVVEGECGDGERNALAEECDGSDRGFCGDGEACADDCTCEVLCGNGTTESGEACDPAATPSGCEADETCTAACLCIPTPGCGDGVVIGPERCEPGVDEAACAIDEGCSATTCTCEPLCGNGGVDAGEECDTAEAVSSCAGDQVCATGACFCVTPICNDGFIDGAETCDFDFFDGTPFGDCIGGATPICHPTTCTCAATVCGDGELDAGETCEVDPLDGDLIGACGGGTPLCDPASCTCAAAVCGDGAVTGSETCDVDAAGQVIGCAAGEPVCANCACEADSCPAGIAPIAAAALQVGGTFRWEDEALLPEGASAADPACESFTGAELVYELTVPAGGGGRWFFTTVTAATSASGARTVLEVRGLCNPDADTVLGCNDGGGVGRGTELFVDGVQEGDHLFIFVDAWSPADNGLEVGIRWGQVAAGAENDVCDAEFAGCGPGLVCVASSCELDTCDPLVDAAAPAPVNGVYGVSGTFSAAPSVVAACGVGAGSEAVIAWTVPDTGTYLFTSDTATTRGSGADTVLAVRDRCSAAAPAHSELGCNDESPRLVSSFEVELQAGAPLFVFVDSFDPGAAGRAYEVQWGRVVEVGDTLACDQFRRCAAGLVCSGGSCNVAVDPAITSLDVLVALDPTVNLILVAGTDPNQDVTALVLRAIALDGSDLGGLTYELDATLVSYGVDDFTIQAPLFLPAGLAPAAYSVAVVDSTGKASAVVVEAVADSPGLGADCPVARSASNLSCLDETVCVADVASELGGTCTAAAGDAPVLSTAGFDGFLLASPDCDGGDAAAFSFVGSADAVVLGFTFQADSAGPDPFVFDVDVPAAGSFALAGQLCVGAAAEFGGTVASLRVLDVAGRTSEPIGVNVPRLP